MTSLLKPLWQIGGDGFGYYAYLRSFIFDGNFDLKNEFILFDSLYGNTTARDWITGIGKTGNPFAVGAAILWLPFVLLAKIINSFFDVSDVHGLAGFNLPYQLAIGLASWFYFLCALAILFNVLKKIVDYRFAWFGILATVALSPAVYYLIYEPSMAHALTVFSTSLLFWISYKIYKSSVIELKDYLYLGLITALAFLIRWQDVLFAIIPLAIILRKIYIERKIMVFLPAASTGLIAFVLGIMPQLIMWKHLYGEWIAVPQGARFFHLKTPHIFDFLFSSYHGMLIVHPLLLAAFMGLIIAIKRHKFLIGTLLLALFLQIYMNSGLYDWYGGGSFGARRMLSSFFIFSLGFSVIGKYLYNKKTLLFIMMILVFTAMIFNALLMMSYARGIIPLNEYTSYEDLYGAPIEVLKNL